MFDKLLNKIKSQFELEKGLIAETYVKEKDSFLSKKYQENVDNLNKIFKECSDVIFREFKLKLDKPIKATLIYLDGLVDRSTLQIQLIKSLMDVKNDKIENPMTPKQRLEYLMNNDLIIGEVAEENDIYTLVNKVLSGEVVFFIENYDQALIINARGWEARGIQEPESESVIRGPREGFVETLRFNTSMVRRRLKDPNLKIKMMTLGKKTNTDIALMYLQGIVKDEILEEVEKRLKTVNIDGVFESGHLEEFIEDNFYSPFPQLVITERPDRVAGNLLEGRVSIIIDGSPMAIIVPATFAQFYQSPEDYYERSIFGTAVRTVRLFSFLIATTATSLYVALVAFHQYLIPSDIVLSVAQSRVGVPFPTIIEAIFMEGVIELIREASIRLPGSIGQVIGIVGALVIGQSAVQAKLASPILIIIVAVSAIASYIVPQFSTSYSIRFMRFPMILAAGAFGALGIAMVWIWLLIHLCTLESFGQPYLAGAAPFRWSDLKDTVIRAPLWMMGTRPTSPENEDIDRLTGGKGDNDQDDAGQG